MVVLPCQEYVWLSCPKTLDEAESRSAGAALAAEARRALCTLGPLLDIASSALQAQIVAYLGLQRATAKLGYVATALFAGLVQEGFCTFEESEEPAGGEGAFKEAEGTVSASLHVTGHMHLLEGMPGRTQ